MAAKIKDGLFIGDAETSQSEVFINDNKISNLINLSGREVHNVWASHGLVYLTYYWEDRPDYKLFSGHEDPLLTDIVEFIDVSISHGISVLLFSRRGTGRCVVAACVYLMMKYHWGFEKTYDYVYSKKPDIDLNKGFIQQMFALDMKLLAARQKAQAHRNGMPNTFKIEANMTISDISAMLPPVEARRWNAWDPDYVLEGAAGRQLGTAEESKGDRYHGGSKGAEAKTDARKPGEGVTLSGPGTGEDDELILIYSFLNSKNTITSLPGPYLDVYATHKDFKLKFNPVCYEEDVNWFPAPNGQRAQAPRGAVKGCRARHAAMLLTAAAQPKSSQGGPAGNSAAEDKRYGDAKGNDATAQAYGTKSVVVLENIAPMYIINSQRESREAAEASTNGGSRHSGAFLDKPTVSSGAAAYYSHPAMTSAGPADHADGYYGQEDASPPHSAASSPARGTNNKSSPGAQQQQQAAGYSNDLYEFVGISTDQGSRSKTSREAPPRNWGPRDSLAVQRDHSLSSINSDYKRGGSEYEFGEEVGSAGRAGDRRPQQQQQQHSSSAQFQQQQPAEVRMSQQQLLPSSSSTQPLSAEERLRNLMADMQRHKSERGGGTARTAVASSRDGPVAVGPSLYDLATMHVGSGPPDRHRGAEYELASGDAHADPLSAFQRQQADVYDNAGGRGGAVRARHDVLAQSGSRASGSSTGNRVGGSAGPPGGPPRSAWGSSAGSRGTSPSNSRPASPSPGPSAPGRYSSPSSGRRSGGQAGSVSSNLSVHSMGSTGSNQQVGSGLSSSSRVYRYVCMCVYNCYALYFPYYPTSSMLATDTAVLRPTRGLQGALGCAEPHPHPRPARAGSTSWLAVRRLDPDRDCTAPAASPIAACLPWAAGLSEPVRLRKGTLTMPSRSYN